MTEKLVKYMQGFKGINESDSTDVPEGLAYNLENLVYDEDKKVLKSAGFMEAVESNLSIPTYDTIYAMRMFAPQYKIGNYNEIAIICGKKDFTVHYSFLGYDSNTNSLIEIADYKREHSYIENGTYDVIVIGDELRIIYTDNNGIHTEWFTYITKRNLIFKDDGTYEESNYEGWGYYSNKMKDFGVEISSLEETDEEIEDEPLYKKYALSCVLNFTQDSELHSFKTLTDFTKKGIKVTISIDQANYDKRLTGIKIWRYVSKSVDDIGYNYELCKYISLVEPLDDVDLSNIEIHEIARKGYYYYGLFKVESGLTEDLSFKLSIGQSDNANPYNVEHTWYLMRKSDYDNLNMFGINCHAYKLELADLENGYLQFKLNTNILEGGSKALERYLMEPGTHVFYYKATLDGYEYFGSSDNYVLCRTRQEPGGEIVFPDVYTLTLSRVTDKIFFFGALFIKDSFVTSGLYNTDTTYDYNVSITTNGTNYISLNTYPETLRGEDNYAIIVNQNTSFVIAFSEQSGYLISEYEDSNNIDYHTGVIYSDNVQLFSNSLPEYTQGLLYNNRLFVVIGTKLLWSKMFKYDSFVLGNEKKFRSNILRVIEYKEMIVIFTASDIYIMNYQGTEENWREHETIGNIGTQYIDTIVPTPAGIFFVNSNGAFSLLSPSQMGKQSYTEYQRIDKNDISEITLPLAQATLVAWYDPKNSRYIIYDHLTAEEYIFSLTYQTFTKVFNVDDPSGILLMGAIKGVLNFNDNFVLVFDYEKGVFYNIVKRSYTKDGYTRYVIETPWITMGLPQVKKKFRRIHVRAKLTT